MSVIKPEWLKKRFKADNANISEIKGLIDSSGLHTVCQSAQCPNIFECFSHKTATFLLMGDRCTRNCTFCSIRSGSPLPLDSDEPRNIARAVSKLKLDYVVLTSVTRDDLPHGGADHIAAVIREIKKENREAYIECLVPDFNADQEALILILEQDIAVFNHNIETVCRNYDAVRPQADYHQSLSVLAMAKELKKGIYTKTGFMLGLGETIAEIKELLGDIKNAGCDMVTIGQYLQPGPLQAEVSRYYTAEEFKLIGKMAKKTGIKAVVSGIFVRSSYKAAQLLETARKTNHNGQQ